MPSASSPPPPPPRSSLLAGLRTDDLLRRATRRTGSGSKVWEPPPVAELAGLLPQFRIESLAGRGGMGAVYRAWQPGLERPVAIKLLAPTLTDDDLFRDRFRREARLLGRLHHPGIVEVHDTGGTDDGQLFYVMEFVEGTDLAQRMELGRVPWPEAVEMLRQMADALAHAHAAGVVHRDVKPSNVLLTESGGVKIADFGLAAPRDPGVSLALTLTGTALGTVEYAAPEQMEGRAVDQRADIFSLGVIGYELLTGSRPRGAFDPPSVRNGEVDPAFDAVILRALQNEPARRFASAEEFRDALLHAADRPAQQERRERVLRRKAARRARAVAALAAVVLLTAGSAVYAFLAKRDANERRAAAEKAQSTAEAAQKETEDVIQFLLTDLRQRLEATGNLGAMESVLERAVTYFWRKHEDSHHTPDAAVQLADALAVKGDVLAARDLEKEAIAHFDEALALAESARAAEPQKPAHALRVVKALARCSRQHQEMELYGEALADARLMLREAEAIRDPAARREEAAAHRLAAFALSWLERQDECRAEYLLAQKILTGLAAAQPDDAAIASDLAGLDMSLGNLAQKQFNFPLMLKHYQAWYDWAKMTKGTDSQYFAHTATRLGHAFVFNRRPAEALAILGDAVRIATQECEAKPGNKDTLNLLYYALSGTAEAQVMIGQDAEAKVTWAKVAEVQTAMAAPPVPEPVLPPDQELAKCQATEAELFTALLAKPEDESAQEAWASASEKLAKSVETVHGLPAAADHGARQLAKLDILHAAAPAGSWWNLGTGRTLRFLGKLHERRGEFELAETNCRRALDLHRRLAMVHTSSHSGRFETCTSAAELARLLISRQRAAAAATMLISVIEEMKPLDQDTVSEWRAGLADIAMEIMAALPAEEALHLADATRAFLTAPGEDRMTSTEMANQAALERAVAKIKK